MFLEDLAIDAFESIVFSEAVTQMLFAHSPWYELGTVQNQETIRDTLRLFGLR